jgi:hypothetical protein
MYKVWNMVKKGELTLRNAELSWKILFYCGASRASNQCIARGENSRVV